MAQVDVNEIKAGRYELLDLRWDRPTSEPGAQTYTFHRHVKGEIVELDEEQAKRLVLAGSAVPEGVAQQRKVAFAAAQLRAELAGLSPEVRAKLLAAVDLGELAEQDVETPVEELHVHHPETVGFTPTPHPAYTQAAHGEGDGGPDPQEQDNDGLVDEGATPTAEDATGQQDPAKRPTAKKNG